jgi:hypothetical protein
MFKVFSEKGFQVVFSNGWEISVMFGAGNYCNAKFSATEPGQSVRVWNKHQCQDAEIAVFNPDNVMVNDFPGCPDYDKVLGWVTPDQVLSVMNWVASQAPFSRTEQLELLP